MPWGNRPHPSDWPIQRTYSQKECPRCGRMISTNARGWKSHIRACVKRPLPGQKGGGDE